MKTIVIKNQEELDALPLSFDEYTVIEIRAVSTVNVRQAGGNSRVLPWNSSSVEAWDNSSVVAWDNSSVAAWGNSKVVARDNSRVEARDSSRVEAWDSSRVEAWDSSSVVAWGNSKVVARDNSRVEARGNSKVEAWDNSRVEARDSSRVEARDSSRVVAWDSSRVKAWDSSRVEAFLCATVICFSARVTIKKLLDNAHLIYKRENCKRPEQLDLTAKITEFNDLITPKFEQWLERGYVVADGITQKLVSQKTVGGVTIFEATDFHENEKIFVAKKGDKFAHGKTIEEAKNDLRYKLSDRDTEKYKSWNIDDLKPLEEMIECYMAITGACSFGTKQFCESHVLKSEYSPKEIIELTSGRYGNEAFKDFWVNRESMFAKDKI